MYALLSSLPVVRVLPRLPLPTLAHWWRVRHERRMLRGLNDHILRDIGLTRAQASREVARPFWDAPPR